MKIHTLTLFFLIFINVAFGQTYSSNQADKLKSYHCAFRINKDSTVNFIYNKDFNTVYAEYEGIIKQINDTTYRVSVTMTIGQFYTKSIDNEFIYIQLESTIAQQLDKIQLEYADGKTREQLQGYDSTGNPIELLKIPINKQLLNEKKGTDYTNITINRKNFLSDDFLSFKIPFGSAASFTSGEKVEFDIVIQDNQLWTVGNPSLQIGGFKLEKVSN